MQLSDLQLAEDDPVNQLTSDAGLLAYRELDDQPADMSST